MSRRRDGLKRLQATNPIHENDVEGPDSLGAQDLLARIVQTPRRPQDAGQPRRRSLRLAVVIAGLALLTAAAAWVWTRTITVPNAVSCYETVDLDAPVAAAPSGGPATADACIPVWESGILTNPDITPEGSIPPLTACVAANGSLAVFPTDDRAVCDQLGLAHPDPTEQDQADVLRAAEDQLIVLFQESECVPMGVAETEVRGILDEAGLVDWTIRTQPANPERPCASHSFDAPSQTVILIPIPKD